MRFSTWRDELRVEFGFSFLDSSVFRDVDGMDLKVYIALCRGIWRSETKGSPELRDAARTLVVTRIGHDTLAKRLGVSVSTVQRSLERLREKGWVEPIQGHGRALYYSLGTVVDGREDTFLADIVRKVVDAEAEAGQISATEPTESADFADPSSGIDDRADRSNMTDLVGHPRPTEEVKGEGVKNEPLPPDGLRPSGAISPPSGGIQETAEVVEVQAVGSPEVPHGGATQEAQTKKSLADAKKAGEERAEELRRGGKINTAGSSSGHAPRDTSGKAAGKPKKDRSPGPDVEDALKVFAASYKRTLGFEFFVGPPQIGQMRTLVKRCGKERALAICEYVLERWPELARRWRTLGHPDLGIILVRVQSIWGEMSGKKGLSPTATRDERTDAQQEARNRMYEEKGKPIGGWDAFVGPKAPASVVPQQGT